MKNKKNSVSAEALSDEAVENITGGAGEYGTVYTVKGSVLGHPCPECHNDCWTFDYSCNGGPGLPLFYREYHCAVCDCLGKFIYYAHNCESNPWAKFQQTTITFKA